MAVVIGETGAAGESLLRVDGLSVAYRSRVGSTLAVDAVSLDLGRGKTLALVGESGSGKSTLAHAVIGLLGGNGVRTGGQVLFAGQRIDDLSTKALQQYRGARIGLVPQDPATSLNPVLRVGEQIAEVLRIHGRADRRTARTEAVRILADAGLDRPELRAGQYPQDLSGGQRQRVLIGIALACEPELIIADEPTSALDVTVQRHILDDMSRRTTDSGTSVLLITHDLGVAADRADRIAVMQSGRIVETGSATEVLKNPRHEYTRNLLDAAPSLHTHRRRSHPPSVAPLLSVAGLHKTFRGTGRTRFTAVEDVSLSVGSAETVALVGESGSGKTTTARLIARLETPDTGTVLFDGVEITGLRRSRLRELRRRIQVVYQNPYSALNPKLTVEEIIVEPLRAFGLGDRAQRRERVAELLDQVGLPGNYRQRRPAELSGGQRQRVAIGRALALRSELLVLDEPVSALDVSVQAQILDLLEQLQSELALSYLFISHDLAVVQRISDRVAVMHDGRIVESGETAEVFEQPQHQHTRELLRAIPGAGAVAHYGVERTA